MLRVPDQIFLPVLVISASLLIPSALSSFSPLDSSPVHLSETPAAAATTQNPLTSHLPLPHRPGRKYIPQGPALEFLIAHNRIRAQYGEPPLKWSRRLARFAHRHGRTLLENCTGVHSDYPYGENLFWATKKYWSPAKIVDAWASEASSYRPNTRSCSTGPLGCGHFTQIVWWDTVRVGCQVMPCVGQGVVGICVYDPPGNYFDESPFESRRLHHPVVPATEDVPSVMMSTRIFEKPDNGGGVWVSEETKSLDFQSTAANVSSAVPRLRSAAAAARSVYGKHPSN